MPLIKIVTGKENSKDGTAEINVFHCPRYPQQRGMSERFVTGVLKDSAAADIMQAVGPPRFQDAVSGKPSDIGGTWVFRNMNVAEGEILKVVAKVKRGGFSSMLRMASTYLQMREEGPYTRIRISLVDESRSTLSDALIDGRFDVLTVEEVEAKGHRVNPRFSHLANPIFRNHLIQIVELEPAITSRKQVKLSVVDEGTAEERVIAVPVRRRRLRRY